MCLCLHGNQSIKLTPVCPSLDRGPLQYGYSEMYFYGISSTNRSQRTCFVVSHDHADLVLITYRVFRKKYTNSVFWGVAKKAGNLPILCPTVYAPASCPLIKGCIRMAWENSISCCFCLVFISIHFL